MNFIGFSLFLTPFIGYTFYKIFNNKHVKYCEKHTNNNYPKVGIKYMKDMTESPKPRKRVRFNNKVENIYTTYSD